MTDNTQTRPSKVLVDALDRGKELLEKTVLDDFYEGGWNSSQYEWTENEKTLLEAMCWFLPRHMAPYDWNRPFAEMILLMVREWNRPQLDHAKAEGAERVVRIERIWAMPNKWTFTIKPIKELLDEEVGDGLWVDPFAGENSPAKITNDLNPDAKATYHLDALEFLKRQPSASADGVLFDPPYSISQAAECYKSYGKEKLAVNVANMGYWAACKDEVARILKPNGKAIVFGWSTNGIGLNRGFQMRRILIVPHGGSKNDTLVTVEIKSAASRQVLQEEKGEEV